MNLKQTPFLKVKTIKIDIEKESNTEGVHFLKSTDYDKLKHTIDLLTPALIFLKAKLIAAGNGLIQDAVITGHDRAFLGAIAFPELNFCRKMANLDSSADLKTVVNTPSVLAALQTVLNDFAQQATGSSTLIKRALFADFELSIDKGEITDKGTINQRQILENWAGYVARIYDKSLKENVLEVLS